MNTWQLEFYNKETGVLDRIKIDKSPFSVGRQPGLPLFIDSQEVSRNHAAFMILGDDLTLSDQNSTNGTFVNLKPITAHHVMKDGDIIHFATSEYRLIMETVADEDLPVESTPEFGELTSRFPKGIAELQEMLNTSLLTTVFQEIVSDNGKSVFAYEALGRGRHPTLPINPGSLFQLAESSGTAVHLSEMMRKMGAALAVMSGISKPIFVNSHPRELDNPDRLLGLLSALRAKYSGIKLVLQVHEAAIADYQTMARFKKELKQLNIDLAYDDFGLDLVRLLNLIETPPDFLKFNMAVVQGLHKAPREHRRLVEALTKAGKDAGITLIAKGIDCAEDGKACHKIGFDYLQGYYFSPKLRPQ
jgi:EAL domain-containing protein (putative c-di-GMP-specific phosphodiesterase class I)